MAKFSKQSLAKLATVHPDLQKLFNAVIKKIDIVILCGQRNKVDQEKAVRDGNSKLHYPKSKHNRIPALAVDSAPYPTDWKCISDFIAMGKCIEETAKELGIKISWGGRWKKFKDYPHTELVL